jgi:hypothetical protein
LKSYYFCPVFIYAPTLLPKTGLVVRTFIIAYWRLGACHRGWGFS